MRRILALMMILTAMGETALAQDIALDSEVFVERVEPVARGGARRVEQSQTVRSGDRVVTILRWNATSADRDGFWVVSPIPPPLRFQQGTGSPLMSTDGGRSFSRERRPGSRVTHLRWRVGASDAQRGSGQLSYVAIAR